MGWVKLDDHFGEHPKIARVSDTALALWVTGLAYCNRNLTDGFIPSTVGHGQLRYAEGNAAPAIRELESVGLWHPIKGGWQVHDYADFQPSREAVLAEREAARSRMFRRRSGERTPDVRTNTPDVQAKFNDPVPVPVPQTKRHRASTPRKRDEIADALARAENAEPLEVPASHMRTLCVKANELRKVAPDVTPEEVARRAANWPGHMGDATISGPGVVKWWGTLGAPANGRGPRDRAAEILRGAAARGGEARGSLPG